MPALPDTDTRGVDGAFRVLVTGFGVSSTPSFVALAATLEIVVTYRKLSPLLITQ